MGLQWQKHKALRRGRRLGRKVIKISELIKLIVLNINKNLSPGLSAFVFELRFVWRGGGSSRSFSSFS